MLPTEPVVFVVDDDEALCESLVCLLESAGLSARSFLSAEAFLGTCPPDQPGCMVLDVRMRGMSGMDLLAQLSNRGYALPVIIITGHGDVPTAVRAMRGGVVDFLEKPVNADTLLARIRAALQLDAQRRGQARHRAIVAARLARLTPRETEVMHLVMAGKPNKTVGIELGVTEKTVEVHRRNVLCKMGVASAIELVHLLLDPPAAGEDRVAPGPSPTGVNPGLEVS